MRRPVDGVSDHDLFDCNGDSSDGCEAAEEDVPVLTTPRALHPVRGAYTGSLHAPAAAKTLRPTFVYSASPEECGPVHYEIEVDDSCAHGEMDTCAFDSPEVSDVSEGTSFEPTADLTVRDTAPVGTPYAWRVRACDRTERCSGWSTPAYVNVGRTEHDLDGDGYADVLATSTQGTEVYLGGPNFNGQADARLPSQYGHFVGDLNGDGFADVAGNLGAGSCGGSIEEAVRILYGAADLSDGPSLQTETLCRTGGTISVARMIVDAGDLDGDGFDDLAVAWGSVQTSLLVFLGGDAFRQHDLLQRSAHPDDSARGRGRPALGLFLADLESPRAERTASEPVLGDHWSGAEEPSLARGGPRRMPARQKGRAVINTTIAKNTPSTAG